MIKNYQKNNNGFCFLGFLFTIFFCLSANTVFADGLEVQYPSIAGQTLQAGTKLPDYVLYLFNAGFFIGLFSVVVSLTVAGAMYILSSAKPDLLANAKDRISGAISGLLILVLSYLIITTINPQLSIFTLISLPANNNPPPEAKKTPGVYFYKNSGDCPDKSANAQLSTSSVADLGNLKNQVNSVDIVNNPDNETYYMSILYDNINLWGKCQYINPNSNCKTVDHFAASASVHSYDLDPNGDGVYFFRKPCFNKIGSQYGNMTELINSCKQQSNGYYKITNSQISNIFTSKLKDLNFENVPEDQQNCIKYDDNGECAQGSRKIPALDGENISSIIINGNYLVLFVYKAPNDNSSGPWTSCEEFPLSGDINKLGPQQIRWENIRNNGGVIPNYVVIIPVSS